jgi:hypothetical protein
LACRSTGRRSKKSTHWSKRTTTRKHNKPGNPVPNFDTPWTSASQVPGSMQRPGRTLIQEPPHCRSEEVKLGVDPLSLSIKRTTQDLLTRKIALLGSRTPYVDPIFVGQFSSSFACPIDADDFAVGHWIGFEESTGRERRSDASRALRGVQALR